jgi:hypothetical protein
VTIRNFGDAVSAPIVEKIDGAGATDFALAADACAGVVLAPGESCVTEIDFAPKTDGTETATYGIEGEPGATITLSGDAYLPGALSTPTPLVDFGEQALDMPVDTKTLALSNVGPGPIYKVNASLEGPGASDFTITSCSGSVAVGATCNVYVMYSPHHRGVQSASIVFETVGQPPLRVALAGRGMAPADLTTSVTEVDFGDVPVGTKVSRDIPFTNVGDYAVGTAFATVAQGLHFYVSANTCSGLPGGGSCTLTVTAQPFAEGALQAVLAAGALGGPEHRVTLTGTAVAAH